jgi:glycosyltransferase involved in cell wall biosynthesis
MDFFVFRPTGDDEGLGIYKDLIETQLSGVAWAHNIPSAECLRAITESDRVKRFVAVGREQLDELRDHDVFSKSTYIYNGFDTSSFEPSSIRSNNKKVVYVGALVPSKGFHVLAKFWKNIVSRVPEAELTVIGSGQLYDDDAGMGRWGIAKEEYEAKRIRPHLSTDSGEPVDSVEFKGLMGREKIPIMQSARVGVVNPSGKSENCPGSAIEFQACGTPVVSRAYRGLLDTVKHGETGLLGSGSEIEDHIVTLLKDEHLSREMGRKGISWVKRRFSFESVCRDWVQLFTDIQNGEPVRNDYPVVNLSSNLKFAREAMRQCKNLVPGVMRVPSIYEVKEKIKKYVPRWN